MIVHRLITTAAGILTMLGAAACFDPFSYGPRAGGAAAPDEVVYELDVYPILVARCASCHSSTKGSSTRTARRWTQTARSGA